MLIDRPEGQGQVDRLRRAYDIAIQSFQSGVMLDSAVWRKLTSALIRYARRDHQSGSEEIAWLAVMHVRVASAPLEF